MKRKTIKTSWLAIAIIIFSVFIGDVFADATIVRGEINIDDGSKISFSVPVGLLQALKTSGISAMVENKEELCSLIDSLMGELESSKGNHLLILKAKNEMEAHVWVEKNNGDEPMRASFVFVDIDPGNHEPEVSLRLPQGIFFLGSFIGNQFVEVHGKEVLETIRQLFLAKIKERGHGHNHEQHRQGIDPDEEMQREHDHEQPHHDQQPIEEMHRGQVQEQPHHDQQPIEEMHQRIEHLKEKVDQLRRDGRHEEAEGLKNEVEEIRRKIEEMERGQGHEQPRHDQQPIEEMRQHIEHLKEKIDNLRREGRHEEAEGLKREIEEIQRNIEGMERGQGHEQPHQGPSHNSEQNTRILNEAADNMFKAAQKLREAGMHGLAEQLAREADKFRGEIRN